MAIPNVSEIFADAQSLLGEPSGGEYYTSTVLSPFFGTAFRDLYNLMLKWDLPFVNRDAYFVLPAFTNVLSPEQVGIYDFGEPQNVWERGSVVSQNITQVDDTTPITITVDGTAPVSNTQVCINGVSDVTGVNNQWFITKTGASTFTLNGSVAGGSAGAGGTATTSVELFTPMTPVQNLPQTLAQTELLVWWKWEDDKFYFTGASEPRQLWIEYSTSGAAPASGSVGIDNSRDFLAYRTAALACAARDEDDRAQRLNLAALGPSMQVDGTGGQLRDICIPMLKEKQRVPKRRQPFRPRRTQILGANPWFGL